MSAGTYFDILDRVKPRLPAPVATVVQGPPAPAGKERARALVMEGNGKTVLTTPVEPDGLDAEDFLLRISGRLVGSEKANRNNQFWTAGDLAFGLPSVAQGPLNWLHDERRVVGVLTDATLVGTGEDEVRQESKAASVSTDDRRKMAKRGVALPDGSFPIPDVEHLKSAIKLAHTPAQRRHVIKRAKSLGASNLIPDSWRQSAEAEYDGPPYIHADACMWSFLNPSETYTVQKAAEQGQLFYSMECISKQVQCAGEAGCGHVMDYADACAANERACAHVRDKTAVRRFTNPVFQGAALIVPPVKPGWGEAVATILERNTAAADVAVNYTGNEQAAAQLLAYVAS